MPSKEEYKKNKKKYNDRWNAWARTTKGQFTTSKNHAKKTKTVWNISYTKYVELRNQPCYYCGGELPETSRGLDRVNNRFGYTFKNVVPCCYGCNHLKSDILSKEETLEVVKFLKKSRKVNTLWKS